jgi:sensor histidine kinase YesM
MLSSYFFVTFFSIEAEEISINTNGETITETYYDALLQQGLTIGIIIRIIFFYLHIYLVSPLIAVRRFLKYGVLLSILLGLAVIAELLILSQLYHTWPVPGLTRVLLFIYTFYFITSLGYGLYNAWQASETAKSSLKQQVIQAELSALKAQFDPHFIFNTLNSLLFIAEKDGNKTISAAIEEMSSLMRSVIYDFREQTIPLSKEVNLISQYINLQKLRYDEKDSIDVSLSVSNTLVHSDPMVAPLILLPFVENAFKHGVDIYQDSFINIDIDVVDSKLKFAVTNSNHHQVIEGHKNNGIGLDNMKKRLQILYGNHHTLKIENKDLFKILLLLDIGQTPQSLI